MLFLFRVRTTTALRRPLMLWIVRWILVDSEDEGVEGDGVGNLKIVGNR